MTQLKATIANVERRLIIDALESSGWVQARAAKILGTTQRILGYKIKKYGIEVKTNKGGLENEEESNKGN